MAEYTINEEDKVQNPLLAKVEEMEAGYGEPVNNC